MVIDTPVNNLFTREKPPMNTLESARSSQRRIHETKEQLQLSEGRLRELTDMLPEMVFETGPETEFRFFQDGDRIISNFW